MPFVVEKEVKLDQLGPGWEGAHVILSALSFRETEEMAAMELDAENANADTNRKSYAIVSEILKRKFLRGKAWNGEKLVDLTADDLLDLPVEAVNEIIKTIAGTVNPNS